MLQRNAGAYAEVFDEPQRIEKSIVQVFSFHISNSDCVPSPNPKLIAAIKICFYSMSSIYIQWKWGSLIEILNFKQCAY